MFKFKKFFLCLVLAILLLSSAVFATDNTVLPTAPVADEEKTTEKFQTINEDKYVYDSESFSLSDVVNGNVFASTTTKFVTNPRIGGGIISGNLFALSNDVVIESDVVYSNEKDKKGNYMISSTNSKSIIYGNVYVLANSFTLQAESEIHGDLYVFASNVNIEQNSVIEGNIFLSSSDVTINGQVKGSVYATAKNFNMNYYSYIERDLYLNANKANLSGLVYRNAFITAGESLVTDSDFKVNENLTVSSADSFTFSGKVNGNANINAKDLKLKNDNDEICVIYGDLKYGTKSEVTIPDKVVTGKVEVTDFVEHNENKVTFSKLVIGLFTLLVYVFAVVFLAKRYAPNAIEKLPSITVSHTFINLGIGLASFFIMFVLFVLLCVSGIGVSLAFAFVAVFLFVCAIALPLFLNNIVNTLKFKANPYVKLLAVTGILYLISIIPVFGSAVMFVVMLISIGEVLFTVLNRKANK